MKKAGVNACFFHGLFSILSLHVFVIYSINKTSIAKGQPGCRVAKYRVDSVAGLNTKPPQMQWLCIIEYLGQLIIACASGALWMCSRC
jgi:hypothetical protein